MTDKEFIKHLKSIQPELEKLINCTLPVKIGARVEALSQCSHPYNLCSCPAFAMRSRTYSL